MYINMYDVEIEGVRFKSIDLPKDQLVNRLVARPDIFEFGYIFPISIAGDEHNIIVSSAQRDKTANFKTKLGKDLHVITMFVQLIEQVAVTGGYVEVPADIFKTIYGKPAYESFITFVGTNKDGSMYIDSTSHMYLLGDPSIRTKRPHLELPIVSSYLYLLTSTPMELPGTIDDIKSELIPGTKVYLNYAVNNVTKMEERIKASKLYFEQYLNHINIPEENISKYISGKILDNLPELIPGVNLMTSEELIESFPEINATMVSLMRAISGCENNNENEMKDYIYRYMKHLRGDNL